MSVDPRLQDGTTSDGSQPRAASDSRKKDRTDDFCKRPTKRHILICKKMPFDKVMGYSKQGQSSPPKQLKILEIFEIFCQARGKRDALETLFGFDRLISMKPTQPTVV